MKRYYGDYEDVFFMRIASKIKRGVYRYIGKGSGRIVYDMGNGLVVKEAKNLKGFAQNMEEYWIALNDDSGLFARVYEVSDDYRFLIMDKAEQIRDISLVWDYFKVGSNTELFQNLTLRSIADKYNLLIGDLGRVVNWGKKDGRPVIIDYGFTRKVRRKYYSDKAGVRRCGYR